MTESEYGVPTPELVEAAVNVNIATTAIQHFRAIHQAVLEMGDQIFSVSPDEKVSMVSQSSMMRLFEEILLTMLHGKSFVDLLMEKPLQPIVEHEKLFGKIDIWKWPELREAVLSDPRVVKLIAIADEDTDGYAERVSKEGGHEIVEKLKNLLKEESNGSSTD